MNKKIALNVLWLLPLVLITALSINSIIAQGAASPVLSWAYPPPGTSLPIVYPPPSPSSTPGSLPQKPSEAAQKALDYIAQRDGLPVGTLMILDDHPTKFQSLGREFQVVTLIDKRADHKGYKLLVDLTNGKIEENISGLLDAEAQAYQSNYGKLDQNLYERLQKVGDDDTLSVAVWMAAEPHESFTDVQATAFATLAAKYPQAKAAMERSGKPMDVEDPKHARQIDAEYSSLMSEEMKARTLPLTAELEQRKFVVAVFDGMPSFAAELPKRVIIELSKRDDVSAINLAEARATPDLDYAIPSSLAPDVWTRGFQGSDVTIAILEHGNVNPIGNYLNLSSVTHAANNGIQPHTTKVAACAASYQNTYKGMAPQSTILSAGNDGTDVSAVSVLQWAVDTENVPIVNLSEEYGYTADSNYIDRAFDYLARASFSTIVVAAGNSGSYIASPGKAWNVLTVGAYDDHDNTVWSNDTMYANSSYINPSSPFSDHEKTRSCCIRSKYKSFGGQQC